MASMPFYAICLDTCDRSDFAEEAQKFERRSAKDVAIEVVEFEDLNDGAKGRALVADNPEGKDARAFVVTQRVRITYEAEEA